jgi:site-specific DNA-methyltransferase (cytosine-N4-specific)
MLNTSSDSLPRAKIHPAARLNQLDWSFVQSGRTSQVSAVHPYPAKFIGEIPGTLLDHLPVEDGTCVLDPFVGSGTTLVESQRRGHQSYGIDLNPIACLISRVRTGPNVPALVDAGEAVAQRALADSSGTQRDDIPNVDHWFRSDVSRVLHKLEQAIGDAAPETIDALRLALSAIIVRVSNQDSDTRYAAVSKTVSASDVYRLFSVSVRRIDAALNARSWDLASSTVIEHDAQSFDYDLIPVPVGAIITSPPYPNAYEYWLYHKYRMYWLRKDPVAVRDLEIGARPHYFRKNPHTARTFYHQMLNVFGGATGRLVPGGWMAVVVGRSRIRGVDVDNAEMIIEVADELGLQSEAVINRPILATRKSFNLSHANIKSEDILVFSKP